MPQSHKILGASLASIFMLAGCASPEDSYIGRAMEAGLTNDLRPVETCMGDRKGSTAILAYSPRARIYNLSLFMEDKIKTTQTKAEAGALEKQLTIMERHCFPK